MFKISVVLPVKNGEKYISESVESVLNQTFEDFELLIFDDNSTDSTLDILAGYKDSRIKIFSSKDGFIANLNKGIEISDCLYIARMDADDIMNPVRLETQLQLMENFDIDVCCSWLIVFGERYNPFLQHHGLEGFVDKPLEKLSKDNFVAHPSVMLKKEFLIRHNLRYVDYPYAEDYKLWSEIAKRNGIFYIEKTPLLLYRISKDQVTRKDIAEGERQTKKIQNEMVEFLKANY